MVDIQGFIGEFSKFVKIKLISKKNEVVNINELENQNLWREFSSFISKLQGETTETTVRNLLFLPSLFSAIANLIIFFAKSFDKH